jgi:hypothetical protein
VVTLRSLPKTISAARLRKLERSKLELRNLQLSLATLQRKVTSMEEKVEERRKKSHSPWQKARGLRKSDVLTSAQRIAGTARPPGAPAVRK